MGIKQVVARLLRELADKIDAGNTNLTEQEAMELMSMLVHKEMSKEQACMYLNVSRSQFDKYVKEGLMPKGKKIVGFKELRWYQDELDGALWRMRKRHKH